MDRNPDLGTLRYLWENDVPAFHHAAHVARIPSAIGVDPMDMRLQEIGLLDQDFEMRPHQRELIIEHTRWVDGFYEFVE